MLPMPTDLQRIELAFPVEVMLHDADTQDPDGTMRAFLAPVVAIGGRANVAGLVAWRSLTPLHEKIRTALGQTAADAEGGVLMK